MKCPCCGKKLKWEQFIRTGITLTTGIIKCEDCDFIGFTFNDKQDLEILFKEIGVDKTYKIVDV